MKVLNKFTEVIYLKIITGGSNHPTPTGRQLAWDLNSVDLTKGIALSDFFHVETAIKAARSITTACFWFHLKIFN